MVVFVVTKVIIPNSYYTESAKVENIDVTTSLESAKAKAKGVIADLDQNVYFLSKDFNDANSTIDSTECKESETVRLADADDNVYIVKIERVIRTISSGGGYIAK